MPRQSSMAGFVSIESLALIEVGIVAGYLEDEEAGGIGLPAKDMALVRARGPSGQHADAGVNRTGICEKVERSKGRTVERPGPNAPDGEPERRGGPHSAQRASGEQRWCG